MALIPGKNIGLGRFGEDIALKYLKKRGYRVVERNYRQKWGEIDIVAFDLDKTLVFVEVKTVSGPEPVIRGEDQMTLPKLQKLRRVVQTYVQNKDESFSQNGWRIDLVVITVEGEKARIRHYKNI